jgi:hypothetical protein
LGRKPPGANAPIPGPLYHSRSGFGNSAEQIKSARDKKGRPMTFADAWIASAALQANVPLVTNNTRDFEAVDGLVVLSAPRPV